MTPDELRRMDNNYCIIFEKGLKPIKAEKFWYFKTPIIKEMNKVKLDHNKFNAGDRGVWRKFNPNNPTGSQDNGEVDLKVESLDDLFEDDIENPIVEEKKPVQNEPKDILFEEEDEPKKVVAIKDEKFQTELDIQKELEAKFDELFGSLEDDSEESNDSIK